MWKAYRHIVRKYPGISLQEERRLIREPKREDKLRIEKGLTLGHFH